MAERAAIGSSKGCLRASFSVQDVQEEEEEEEEEDELSMVQLDSVLFRF